MLKKLLIALAVVLVVLVAAVLIVPGLIPADTYRDRIAAQVEAATGRELTIGGDVDVAVFPRVAIAMDDVAFANAPGGGVPDMVTLRRLDVQLAIWPLLTGEVVVDRFVLVEPVIALEINDQGRANWDFAQAGAPAGAPADTRTDAPADREAAPAPSDGAAGGGRLSGIRLGDVRIEDGRVTYSDARSGARHEASDVDLTLSLPDLDSPFRGDGALTWNDERVRLTLSAERPRVFLESGESAAAVTIASNPVELAWQGRVVMGGTPAAAGALDLDVPSVRELAAWAGSPVEGMEGALGPLTVKGNLALEGAKASFTEAAIALDEIRSQGALVVDATGAKPVLSGRLDVEALDLNPYLPPEGGAGEGGAGQGEPAGQDAPARPAPPAEQAGWSEAPLDFSPLRAADADFELTAGAIKFREIEIGRSALILRLQGGRLVADLTEMALYQGGGTARLVADGSGDTPAVEAKLDVEGVQAEPLLTDAAGFERLSGTANGEVAVTARGASQAAMVAASQGQGRLAFTDGAIKGINLAAMVRNVESAFLDPKAREAQATDFSELSGSFTITDGILRNEDLSLQSPLLRVAGKGTADLPQRTVDYRVEPRAVASVEGQGGRGDVGGVMVPVLITGPWDNLSYRPDLEGVLKQQLQDPGKALEQLRGLRGGGAAGGTEGGAEGGSDGDGSSTPSDAEKTLRGILGR